MTDISNSTKINFLGANNGELEMHYMDLGVRKILTAKTVEQVINCIDKVGGVEEDNVFASSSMNFASEWGFKKDQDAQDLWDAGYSVWHVRKHEETEPYNSGGKH
jgi:hypothetical protein